MGDLKPLGSEKLKADEKLKRILELTYYNDKNKKSTNNTELVKESTNGGVYGIVKERDGYYVKMGLNEQSLDYIGGLFMKNKNRFSSYSEALKRLELIKGQDELQEATKYVLKSKSSETPPPAAESPVPSPEMDAPAGDMELPPTEPPVEGGEMGTEPMPSPEEPSLDVPSEDVPSEEGPTKKSDYMAEVQKYAGKLGQELRDMQDKMESDDIKYVLNMIISAVDLDKLDLEDLEDISDKFKRDEETPEMGDEEMPEPEVEEPTDDTEVPSEEPAPEGDLGEYDDPMSKLEEFIDTPITQNDEIDLSNFADIKEDDVVELDMNEIQKAINQSVGETLSKYFKN